MKQTPPDKTPPKQDLQSIPGIGKAMAQCLMDLGCQNVTDLQGQDPERLYRDLCILRGHPVDRCVLYVFRCAVYYASNSVHDAECLKWWNWKDRQPSQPS